mgnify:CR=1 FL=1
MLLLQCSLKGKWQKAASKIEFSMNVDIERGPGSIFWIGGAIVVPA